MAIKAVDLQVEEKETGGKMPWTKLFLHPTGAMDLIVLTVSVRIGQGECQKPAEKDSP